MWDQGFVMRLKSFVAKRTARPTPEECDAWAEFYLVIEPIIRINVRRVHKAWDIVDDVCQTAPLKVIKGLRRLTLEIDRTGVERWVATIATREALRFLRRKSRPSRRHIGIGCRIGAGRSRAGTGGRVRAHAGARVILQARGRILRQLARNRAADRADVLGGARSLADIAKHVDMSEDAVWWVLRRIKPKLQDYLRRGGLGRR